MKAIINKLFNVNESEQKTVVLLFFHHFFQGFGLALVFIIANSLFLSHFSVKELPKVYIASGLLVLLFGRVYAWYEHQFEITKLLRYVVFTSFLFLMLLWLGGFIIEIKTYSFILICLFQVLYLLYSLEFWGLSALVFDVRQSKRLFGLISAGDIPAKMIGYLVVGILAAYLSLNNLILLSAISVLSSMYFLQKILKSHRIHEHNSRDFDHHYKSSQNNYVAIDFLKRFFKNRFIFVAAILSFIVVITLAAINFAFLSEVKYNFKTDKDLAAFFGLFFAAGQFITIFTKAFFSGRVIQWLGVKKALLSLPSMIIIILGIGLVMQFVNSDYRNLIYIYGFLMMATEILNYALHQPMFLSLFQPLNAHLRLHGHTVIKGFVDGLGSIIAGLGLLFLLYIGTTNNLMSFGLVIISLALIWLTWVVYTKSAYIHALKDAIKIRRLTGTAFEIKNEELSSMITSKIKDGRPWETIYHLQLLQNNNSALFTELIDQVINHPSSEIKEWAFQNYPQHLIEQKIPYFKELVFSDLQTGNYSIQLIKYLAATDPQAYDWSKELMDTNEGELLQALIEGLLKGRSIEGMVLAGNKLLQLKDSKEEKDKLITCKIIGSLELRNFHGILAEYLNSENPIIYQKAVETASKLKILPLFETILHSFESNGKQSWYLNSLIYYEEATLDHFLKKPTLLDENKSALESILYLAQHISSSKSAELLLHHNFLKFSDIRQRALEIISRMNTSESDLNYENVHSWLAKDLDFLSYLKNTNSKEYPLDLQLIVNLEIKNARERIFNYLHILYPKDNLPSKRDAYFSQYDNKRANAIENLDSLLEIKHKMEVIPLLETKQVKQNVIPVGEWLIEMIKRGHMQLSAFSLASCLKWLEQNNITIKIDPGYLESDWKIISQQAKRLYHNTNEMAAFNLKGEQLLELEKVSILKNTSLFNATPENLLVDLASLVKTVRLEKGDILFKEGDPGDSMFILHSGQIEIRDENRALAKFGELDFFGELALLDDEPRSATAIAAEETLLLSISQEDFYELITFRTEVAKSVLRVLSQRLRKQNKS